jgi:MFS family permease
MLAPIATPAQRPTHVRYWVVVFAVALAVVTYIDRVCISFAAPAIRADLHLSKVQMGYAFSAFAWAYALFEIPGGFWATGWARAAYCCASCCGGRSSRRPPDGRGTSSRWR